MEKPKEKAMRKGLRRGFPMAKRLDWRSDFQKERPTQMAILTGWQRPMAIGWEILKEILKD
ncbi:MAG: hypothetical protein AAB837_02950 [Patescibacteria group bacterium]